MKKLITAQVEGLMNIDHIVSITLYDENGEVMQEKNKENIERLNIATKTYEVVYSEEGEEELVVGKLTLVSTQIFIARRIVTQAIRFFISQGVKTLLVSVLLLFVFHQLILRHLISLSEYLRTLKLGENEETDKLIFSRKKDAEDELSLVEGEVNELVERLKKQISEQDRMLAKTYETLDAQRDAVKHSAKLASIGEFSASIVHEIKNPLTFIVGSLTMIKRELKDYDELEKTKKRVEQTFETAQQMSRIADTMLRLSRKEAVDSDGTDIQMGHLIDTIKTLFAAKSRDENVPFEIESHVDENMVFVSDLDRISMVLINIVNNAIGEAKEHDKPQVTFEIKAENEKLKFSVLDSGTGIPKDIADKIFQPFFTTKISGEGTGLGLPLSKKIADDMNGLLYVDHERDRTCFTFEIPLVQSGAHKEVEQQKTA